MDWELDGKEPAVPWKVDRERRVHGLRVVLAKRTYVLPWTQFLYAEGTAGDVRALFSLHDVVVKECGLDVLLADLAAQAVTELRQPARAETFQPLTRPGGSLAVGASGPKESGGQGCVRSDQPPRTIRAMTDRVFAELSPLFSKMYSDIGRPSIPLEQQLHALLIQSLYTIRGAIVDGGDRLRRALSVVHKVGDG